MSRSYKKPWVKDPANRYMKKLYARAYRRVSRHIIEKLKDGICQFPSIYNEYYEDYCDKIMGMLPHRRDIMNMYDICDFRFPCTKVIGGKRK